MKYRFQVMVALTYEDKRKQVSVDLTDKEVARIKKYIAKESEPQDLLQILEDNDTELFEKFWDVIFPKVFVEMLINGLDNGYIERRDNDDFDDYSKAKFDRLYTMYGDEMELEHSSCCICKIPKDFL